MLCLTNDFNGIEMMIKGTDFIKMENDPGALYDNMSKNVALTLTLTTAS